MKITVLLFRPHQPLELVETGDDYTDFRRLLGTDTLSAYVFRVADRVYHLWCDDEAYAKELPPSGQVVSLMFFGWVMRGPYLVTRILGDEDTSVSPEDVPFIFRFVIPGPAAAPRQPPPRHGASPCRLDPGGDLLGEEAAGAFQGETMPEHIIFGGDEQPEGRTVQVTYLVLKRPAGGAKAFLVRRHDDGKPTHIYFECASVVEARAMLRAAFGVEFCTTRADTDPPELVETWE